MPALQICVLIVLTVSMVTVDAVCPIINCSCSQSTVNPALQVIDCRNKGFTQVPTIPATATPGEFYELTLAGNAITSIPDAAFSNLRLHVLDLSNNKLAAVSADAFQGLEAQLTDLKLGGDQTGSDPAVISYTFLTNLTNLQNLDIRYFRQTTIDQNTFPTLSNLQALKLQSMKIQFILSTGFEDKFPALTRLEIVGNVMLNVVPVSALRFLTTLQHLSLKQNNISHITFDAFGTLQNLLELDLSHNEINNLVDNCFQGLYNKLEFLSLFLNRLDQTKLRPVYTKSWLRLEQLNIGNNMLTDIPSGFFTNMPGLAYLNLLDNKLTTVKTTYFTNLPAIHHIDISYNPIASIEDQAFAQVPTLTELDLEYLNERNPSQILSFTPSTIQGLENSLQKLNLKMSKVSQGEIWNAIKLLTKLNRLILQGSGLTGIQDLAFSRHNTLSYLDLSMNQISNVTQESFYGLQTSLLSLDLQQNDISSIDECVFKDFTALELFYLNSNPTHCDCGLKWLKDLANNASQHHYFAPLKCITPSSLVNQYLFSVTDQDLGCGGYVSPTCKDLAATTTPAPPPTTTTAPTLPLPTLTIAITNYNETSISVSWNVNDLRLIAAFKITYTTGGVTQETDQLDKGDQTRVITGLTHSTAYRVCIHIILTDNTRTPVESCDDVTTPPPLPRLTSGVVSSTTTTIKVSWSINDLNLVTGYSLVYDKFGTTTNNPTVVPVDRTKTEITIDGLDADNKYEICLNVLLRVSGTVMDCFVANTKVGLGPSTLAPAAENNAGVIAGAVVGGVVAVVILVAILYILFIRKGKPKQPLPPIQQTTFSTAAFPQTTDHARRFIKSKPGAENGAHGIKVISSGKMDPEDSSRISGGSYQTLNEGQVQLQPIPFNSRTGANGKGQDYLPPSYHSYMNAPQPPRGNTSSYSNDINKRPLPPVLHRDEFGFTNKGFKPESLNTSPASPSSPASPNIYNEIPI